MTYFLAATTNLDHSSVRKELQLISSHGIDCKVSRVNLSALRVGSMTYLYELKQLNWLWKLGGHTRSHERETGVSFSN